MAKSYVQNVPIPYMDVQTLWNDRRDPHANPLASTPRREEARAAPGNLSGMLNEIYQPGPFDTEARDQVVNERLYTSSRRTR
jgi:hypothetical protein